MLLKKNTCSSSCMWPGNVSGVNGNKNKRRKKHKVNFVVIVIHKGKKMSLMWEVESESCSDHPGDQWGICGV